MTQSEAAFLPGTLNLLILKTVAMGPTHGWGISRRIRTLSSDVLEVNQGSLYPALQRLEQRGLIHATWGTLPDGGRRVRVYQLTPKGRTYLAHERDLWSGFVAAVQRILETA
ncbi:MAG: PadR family transcriptional regulator [Vicinamibacterales bacterium]